MAKTLGLIAVGGLSVGVASLALAYALVGHDVANFLDRDTFLAHSCGDNSGKGDAKQRERRLAWEGDDTVEISLPASVRYRGGEGSDVIVRGSPDVIAHVEVHRGRITLDCHRFGGFRDIEVTLPGRTSVESGSPARASSSWRTSISLIWISGSAAAARCAPKAPSIMRRSVSPARATLAWQTWR
jgi:hypothetical protein